MTRRIQVGVLSFLAGALAAAGLLHAERADSQLVSRTKAAPNDSARIDALEARLAELEGRSFADSSGTLVLKRGGGEIRLSPTGDLVLKAKSLTLESQSDAKLKAAAALTLEASADSLVKGGARVELQAPVVQLGGSGGQPLARVGDAVGSGKITGGSTGVFAR